jgi:hypothetical protein
MLVSKKPLLLFIFVLLAGVDLFAQCCSPGNPVGGTVNVGILQKNMLRAISFYRYSYSDSYFDGSNPSDFSFLKHSSYHFAGSSIAFGITDRLNIEQETGYFIRKQQDYNLEPAFSLHGYGFSNGITSLRLNLIKSTAKDIELTIGAGVKYPFSKQMLKINNVEMPRDLQPSTGAFGSVANLFLYKKFKSGLRAFLIQRYEYNGTNLRDYQTGQMLISSLFISKSLDNRWAGILQARHEFRARDIRKDKEISSSGGHLVFLSPQINYSIKQWNISTLVDFPVFRKYNGVQFATNMAFALNLTRDIKLEKKAKEAVE